MYCGLRITDINSIEQLVDLYNVIGEVKVVRFRGLLFAIDDNVRKAREIVSLLDFIAKISNYNSDAVELDNCEKEFLLGWDAEKYRTSI